MLISQNGNCSWERVGFHEFPVLGKEWEKKFHNCKNEMFPKWKKVLLQVLNQLCVLKFKLISSKNKQTNKVHNERKGFEFFLNKIF